MSPDRVSPNPTQKGLLATTQGLTRGEWPKLRWQVSQAPRLRAESKPPPSDKTQVAAYWTDSQGPESIKEQSAASEQANAAGASDSEALFIYLATGTVDKAAT